MEAPGGIHQENVHLPVQGRLDGVEDFRDQIAKLAKGKPVALLVQEKDGSRWLTMTLPDGE